MQECRATLVPCSTGTPGCPGMLQEASPHAPGMGTRDTASSTRHITLLSQQPDPAPSGGPGPAPLPPVLLRLPLQHMLLHPPSFILHLAFSILTAQSSSGASLPSCSGAEGETKGAERASVPVSFPMGCRWSHHTSMPGACPKPSACTSSSLSPLFSVRRTVGTGEWLLGHCALGFVALVWV